MLLQGIQVDNRRFFPLFGCFNISNVPVLLNPDIEHTSNPRVWVKAAFVALIGLLLCLHVFLIDSQATLHWKKQRWWQEFELFFVCGAIVWYSVCYFLNTRTGSLRLSLFSSTSLSTGSLPPFKRFLLYIQVGGWGILWLLWNTWM